MRLFLALFVLVPIVLAATDNRSEAKAPESSLASVFVDDVVVESTLNVKRKNGGRQGRKGSLETASRQIAPEKIDGSTVLKLQRPKRQGRQSNKRKNPYRQPGVQLPQQYGSAFPQYNPAGAGAFPQYNTGAFKPLEGSASNAQAQAFQANSPFGNFGAAASNAGSQGFSYGPDGVRGSAGLSGSQSYNLPNGNTLAVSYANGFSFGPDGQPTFTRGNSIAYTGSDGKPVPGFAAPNY